MGRLSLRFVALGYLTLILVGPLFMMVWRTAEDLDGAWAAITDPDTIAAFKLTLIGHGDRGRREHGLRDRLRARDRARQHPRQGLPQRLRRPAALALAGDRRASRSSSLYGVNGWFGWFQRNGYEILFATPVDRARHDLRDAAVRRARGRADAPRDRHRAGAGRPDARRVRLADLLAHHAPVDPVGRHLRRRAHRGARDRRVRRGGDRLGEHRRQDADGDAPGRGRVPVRVRELRARLRHLLRARRDGDPHPDRDDRPPTEGERGTDVDLRPSRHEAVRRLRRARRRVGRGRARDRSPRSSARAAAASPRCCGSSPGSRRPDAGSVSIDGQGRDRRARRRSAASASCSSTTPPSST